MPYDVSAPEINPNTFPYQRKWTKEETDELGERIQALRDAMVDMVGVTGVTMFIDAGSIANIATHLALAGTPAPVDELAYIWRDAKSDKDDLFEVVQWHVKVDVPEPPPEPEGMPPEVAAKIAEQAEKDIMEQLPPEARRLLIRNLAKEFVKDTTDEEEGGA